MDKRVEQYEYRVFWSDEDEEFVATVAEFPSMSNLAITQEEALRGMIELIAFVVDDMVKSGEPVPEPRRLQSYSGKVHVRMPNELHRELMLKAQDAGVSLNQYIVSLLSRGAGMGA
jgi:predicted HicB family RNase H-like nuclease